MAENIKENIQSLRTHRNAVILVHNYAPGDVQDIGDFVGDSLELARKAAATDADVIVFCGVHFMAETAAILSPDKTVLMPDREAGCPMANMATPRELAEYRRKYPDASVVTYVNSSAEIKAMSDICCTSANAVDIVGSFPENRDIIFVPDRNLGAYVEQRLGRKLILWPGYCPTHHRILLEQLRETREQHPGAPVIVHPECRPEIIAEADAVGSTSQILRYCRETTASEIIVGTEIGILHRLEKENPGKTFYPASPIMDCPNMKLNTLEKVMWVLEDMAPVISLDEETAEKARIPIERMLEQS